MLNKKCKKEKLLFSFLGSGSATLFMAIKISTQPKKFLFLKSFFSLLTGIQLNDTDPDHCFTLNFFTPALFWIMGLIFFRFSTLTTAACSSPLEALLLLPLATCRRRLAAPLPPPRRPLKENEQLAFGSSSSSDMTFTN